MGYYVRVFCKAEKLPSVNDVLEWFDARGCQYSIEIADPDIDDDGLEANWKFLRYFERHFGGMIHADGEGFYENERLIVKVR